jgi:hypothetical protein
VTLQEHVSVVTPGLAFDRQRALVAAARSRGVTSSVDEKLREARQQLAAIGDPVPSLEAVRRRVAESERDIERKRERVATLRGRVQASDSEATRAEYRGAVRELAEAETERAAAREALATAREQARERRDERERRLRLEDRVGNLERRARSEIRDSFEPVVDGIVPTVPGAEAFRFEAASSVTAALALVRAGVVRVPVVLACRRFPDRPAAESWLQTPVIRL